MFDKFLHVIGFLIANIMAFRINLKGSRRIVFVFDKVVIKIPKFNRHPGWLMGMMENLTERYWWCADGSIHEMSIDRYPLAPIVYADRWGLCVVMQKARLITEEEYARRGKEVDELRKWGSHLQFITDSSANNVGEIDEKLVIIDYGYFGLVSTYLGSKAYNRVRVDPYDDDKQIVTRTLAGHWFDFKKAAKLWIKGTASRLLARAKLRKTYCSK